jgi:hypothetical protein
MPLPPSFPVSIFRIVPLLAVGVLRVPPPAFVALLGPPAFDVGGLPPPPALIVGRREGRALLATAMISTGPSPDGSSFRIIPALPSLLLLSNWLFKARETPRDRRRAPSSSSSSSLCPPLSCKIGAPLDGRLPSSSSSLWLPRIVNPVLMPLRFRISSSSCVSSTASTSGGGRSLGGVGRASSSSLSSKPWCSSSWWEAIRRLIMGFFDALPVTDDSSTATKGGGL